MCEQKNNGYIVGIQTNNGPVVKQLCFTMHNQLSMQQLVYLFVAEIVG